MEIVDKIEDLIVDYLATGDLSLKQELIEIRASIDRTINQNLYDPEFIKYNKCGKCGTYPPPADGFMTKSFNDVKVPLCQLCETASEKDIDWKEIARTYARYTEILTKIFNQL